jgi:argininosuccinate lyase
VRQQTAESYRGFRTAGIRLTEEVVPSLMDHRTDTLGDTLGPIHQFDKAHLVMLSEREVIPRADGAAMLREIRDMEKRGVEATRLEVGGGMHSGEQFLIRRLGESVGGRIHAGRSSGDLGEVGRRVAMRDSVLVLMNLTNELRAVLLRLIPDTVDAVMPGHTHGQQAQPTTYGHWLSMWAYVFARDFERFRSLYSRLNMSPAGAAILTGSDFDVDRARTSDLLGFNEPIVNTMDAILSHDDILECTAVMAVHGANIERLGEDLMLWSTAEFGMIDFPDRFCGTSSIMMQKKNPYAPQAMKALGGETAALSVMALYVEKGSTGLPIMERHATETAMWSAFANTKARLRDTIELLPDIKLRRERMEYLAGAHWAQATDVAAALVHEKGLPWRTAHQIVGILVRLTEERGIAPRDVTTDLLDEAAIEYMDSPVQLSQDVLQRALDPRAFVERRVLLGGPSAAAVLRELPGLERGLAQDIQFMKDADARVAAAAAQLEEAIDALVGAKSGAVAAR